jgi:hypothetical protein
VIENNSAAEIDSLVLIILSWDDRMGFFMDSISTCELGDVVLFLSIWLVREEAGSGLITFLGWPRGLLI